MTKVNFVERTTVEQWLDGVNIVIRKADRSIDTEATNDYRLTEARKRRLYPVVNAKDGTFYRLISSNDGLTTFGYSTMMPSRLEVLENDDVIPLEEARRYLGVDEAQMRAYIKDKKIRKSDGKVNLDDVNKVKFGDDGKRNIEDKL
ncbi:MAG TPA: hypothetical protein VJI46_01890 [Candidatus Nanoarchaeia archaeon]|nr:hypothetical protein [Candidatus Nanoarchaeia archaeon]